MNKKVSVIMSCYNEEIEWIKKSIESILSQTYKNLEFIIVLDNPNNYNIIDILECYKSKDNRIKLIYNNKNIGLAKSLNKAIEISTGEFIARMDADDISTLDRIEKQIEYLIDKQLDMIFSNRIEIDETGDILYKKKILSLDSEKIKKLLPLKNFICHPSVVIKSEVIKLLKGYRNFYKSQDYDLWLRVLSSGYKIGVIDEYLIYYRIRNNSISSKDKYYQYLLSEYQKVLYNERVSNNNEDTFSTENIDLFLKRNKYYSKNKKDKFNKSQKLFYESVVNLKNKKYIKCIYKLNYAIITDFALINQIKNILLFNLYKKY